MPQGENVEMGKMPLGEGMTKTFNKWLWTSWQSSCFQHSGTGFKSSHHQFLWDIFFKKNGPIPASFCLFSLFSRYNFNNTNWKKRRWCAWDSNPGPQDGRCRRKQGAMAATLGHLFAIDFILKMSIKKEDSSNGPFYTEITVTYIIT